MTKDKRLKNLVRRYFTPDDYFLLRSRMIGSGAIGGKACGMVLARKICETEIPEFTKHSEPHDSFYIGSDVFIPILFPMTAGGFVSANERKKAISAPPENCGNICSPGSFPPTSGNSF